MLFETALICTVILALTYRWHHFELRILRRLELLFASIAIVIVAIFVMRSAWRQRVVDMTFYIQLIRFGCLAAFIVANVKTYTSMSLFALGYALNALVIIANAGFMPVDISMANQFGYTRTIESLRSLAVFGHAVLDGQTRLPLLADIIHLVPPYPLVKSISIGDIIIDIALISLTVEAIVRYRKVNKHVV